MVIRNILIVQTAFIGDVVLATPLIRALRESFPHAQIAALILPATGALLHNHPYLDQVFLYDKKGRDRGLRAFFAWTRTLKVCTFDLTLVPHRSLRSALLVHRSGIPRRIGFDRSAGAFLFTDVVPYRTDLHEVNRNLTLLHPLGIEPHPRRPELFPDEGDRLAVEALLEAQGANALDPFIAIAPGSVWPTKRWLPERFGQVADRLLQEGFQVVFIGGSADRALCESIVRGMRHRPIIAAGRWSLLQSAAFLSQCTVLLSNDSAPVHMAVAMGTRVVALFGPTVPAFGFAPYGPGHTVIQRDLACRPCSRHGGRRCPQGHFRCMKEISSEDVLRVLLQNSH